MISMVGHERVLRAITFDDPDRIPLAKGDDPDIAIVGYRPARDFAPDRSAAAGGRIAPAAVWAEGFNPTQCTRLLRG